MRKDFIKPIDFARFLLGLSEPSMSVNDIRAKLFDDLPLYTCPVSGIGSTQARELLIKVYDQSAPISIIADRLIMDSLGENQDDNLVTKTMIC